MSGVYTEQYHVAFGGNEMPQVGKNAKLYMERKLPQFQSTLRGPGPQICLADNPVHNLKLEAPLPKPEFLYNRTYVDGGKTKPWPGGNFGGTTIIGATSQCNKCNSCPNPMT